MKLSRKFAMCHATHHGAGGFRSAGTFEPMDSSARIVFCKRADLVRPILTGHQFHRRLNERRPLAMPSTLGKILCPSRLLKAESSAVTYTWLRSCQ